MMRSLLGLVAWAVLLFFSFLGLNGEVWGNDSHYYWAQGQKIQVDSVPDQYLALYGASKTETSSSLNYSEGSGLETVSPPSGIHLPANTGLVRVKEDTDLSGRSLYSEQTGQQIRALIRAYRDHNTNALVLPTEMIIVRFRPGVDEQTVRTILNEEGLVDIAEYPDVSGQFTARCVSADVYIDPLEAANRLYGKPEILFCHPDMVKEKIATFVPNDPFYTYQWNLYNEGQNGGQSGADIQIEEAWDITLGSHETLLGITDNGTMKDHEDLQGNYIAGKNYLTGSSDPTPTSESEDWHGTATAGLALGRGDNGKGISGVCPHCGLVAVRYGSLSTDDANAFYWQNQQGVAVSSNSWGYTDGVTPDVVYYAIQDVALNGRNGLGMVVVVAAGNEARIIPSTALAAHPNVLAIGASTNHDLRASYSNYGSHLSIMAPSSGGTDRITTTDVYSPVGEGYNPGDSSGLVNYTNGRYTNDFGGTSAACPQVAGVIGLMLAVNADLPRLAVKRALEYTADKIGSMSYEDGWNSLYGYGRVNALKAVWAAQTFAHTGWWYTPGEDGTGLSIETQGLAIFLTWYVYDAQTGQPVWLTSGGVMDDPYHYSGSLLQWTGWPLGDSYSPAHSSQVGTIQITFNSENDATMSWTLPSGQGQKTIHTFMTELSPGNKDTRDINGWWYDPDLPGMGVFVEARGGNLFLGWYHYDSNGTPRWWSSANLFAQGATLYSGVLDEWENGQCLGCTSYVSPELASHPSQVSIQFLDQSQAVLIWDGGQLNLERFLFGTLD